MKVTRIQIKALQDEMKRLADEKKRKLVQERDKERNAVPTVLAQYIEVLGKDKSGKVAKELSDFVVSGMKQAYERNLVVGYSANIISCCAQTDYPQPATVRKLQEKREKQLCVINAEYESAFQRIEDTLNEYNLCVALCGCPDELVSVLRAFKEKLNK